MADEKWKESFREGKELILATCLDNNPNANIVISLGFVDNRLLIADSQMKITIKNLKQNKKICIVGGYYRIRGTVEIFKSGKYFEICARKDKKYPVKNAILVDIKEVFDLDKVKKII